MASTRAAATAASQARSRPTTAQFGSVRGGLTADVRYVEGRGHLVEVQTPWHPGPVHVWDETDVMFLLREVASRGQAADAA